VAQQGPPPRHPARLPASSWPEQPVTRGQPAGYGGPDPGLDEDFDAEDLPPWAGLSISPRRPPREGRAPSRPRWDDQLPPDADESDEADGFGPAAPRPGRRSGRAVAARARKARRKIYTWGGIAIAAAFIAAGAWHFFGPKAATPRHSDFVTTYQPGDFRSVPNACRVISAATLNQYLPGTRARAVSASLGASRTGSQCTWTLDARPRYRVLEVTAQAYAPSLLATGDGSATFSAVDSYLTARQRLLRPLKASHLPKATMTQVRGLGNVAFSALQVITTGGDITDLVTLVVRDHNALVTIGFQGLDHSSRGRYGPVSVQQLRAGTVAAAREVLAGLS
jgi:hypothetical protein